VEKFVLVIYRNIATKYERGHPSATWSWWLWWN